MEKFMRQLLGIIFIWIPPAVGLYLFPEQRILIFVTIIIAGLVSFGVILEDEVKNKKNS
jgi:hypothetical protein